MAPPPLKEVLMHKARKNICRICMMKNYEIVMKEIKEDLNKWGYIPGSSPVYQVNTVSIKIPANIL